MIDITKNLCYSLPGRFTTSFLRSEEWRQTLVDEKGNIITWAPGGIVTVAGSKKKIPAQFSRPWQSPIPSPNPAKCPFHRADERTNAFLTDTDPEGERWYVLDSLFAPENPYHRLIIPDTCWEEEKMRHLGGNTKVVTGFELAARQFQSEKERDKLWCFSIQVGPLAAQNVPHCHYHLYRPHIYGSDLKLIDDPIPMRVVMSGIIGPSLDYRFSDFLRIIPGGEYTGMLYFLPGHDLPFDLHHAALLGSIMCHVVATYCEKFRSVEGLAPDYRFEFEIHRGKISLGFFIPKLNNTGTLEDAAIVDRRRGWNLLWSHEETAAHLGSL